MKWLRRAAFALAALAAAALLLSGPLTRMGVLPFQAGIALFLLGGLAGAGALIVSAAGLFTREQNRALAASAALGLLAAALPLQAVVQARSVPAINDISTDASEMRFPEEQRKAYADIQPFRLPEPPPQAHAKALSAAQAMKWEVVKNEPAAGRIEAVDTTGWFGFKDDITVRVSPDGAGSRIDVRSKSRVGKGDAGANAKRIRHYFLRLK